MRPVQRADHVGPAATGRCLEGSVQQAVVHARAVEVGQAQYGGLDAALCVGLQQQVFLRLAHAALEGMRVAWMVFLHGMGLRLSIGIDGADQYDAAHTGGNGAVQRPAHELGMQCELPVVHAHQVDQRVHAVGGSLDGAGDIRVPGGDLGQGIGAEGLAQAGCVAADHAVGAALLSERGGQALADGACGAEECNGWHGLGPVVTASVSATRCKKKIA